MGNKDNERTDELEKLGSKLRHDIMSNKSSGDWMKRVKELYWRNRKEFYDRIRSMSLNVHIEYMVSTGRSVSYIDTASLYS